MKSFLDETRKILKRIDLAEVAAVTEITLNSRRVFTVGNGGGAAHASHMANDLRKIAHVEAYCVNDNAAEISARENDDGWAEAYRGYLNASNLGPGDCLFVFSVGGGSPMGVSANLCLAMNRAGVNSNIVGLVGKAGGYLRAKADASVLIPSDSTPQVEGVQSVLAHMIACS